MIPCPNCKVNIPQRHFMFSGMGPSNSQSLSVSTSFTRPGPAVRLCSCGDESSVITFGWIIFRNLQSQLDRDGASSCPGCASHPMTSQSEASIGTEGQSKGRVSASAWPGSPVLRLMASRCQLWKICNECNYRSRISLRLRLSLASCIPCELWAA